MASTERAENQKKLRGAIDKLFTYVRMSPLQAPPSPFQPNESSHMGQLLKQSYHTFGGPGNKSIDDKSSNYLFQDAMDKSMRNSMTMPLQMFKSEIKAQFKGSTVLARIGDRTELPVKKADAPMPIWKVLKTVIGKDMMRVSMPCFINEPMSGIQKQAEFLIMAHDHFVAAGNTDDPTERVARTFIALTIFASLTKVRKRKPFNPMLGETFEFVTEKFRFLAEKVEHVPNQIVAFEMEGDDYHVRGHANPKP